MIAFMPEWSEELFKQCREDKAFHEDMKEFEGNLAFGTIEIPGLTHKGIYCTVDATKGAMTPLGYAGRSECEEAVKSGSMKACIELPYSLFSKLVRGEISDIAQVLMGGEAGVIGNLPFVLKYIKPLRRFIAIFGSIGGDLPTEIEGDELQRFKAWVEEVEAQIP